MVVKLAESRTVPVAPDVAYQRTLVAPLEDIFAQRHLVLPPVVSTEGQDGVWGSRTGQTRTIRLGDGGSLHETLTELQPPRRFGYRIDQIRGPLRPLVRHVDGAWSFQASGSGTSITWSWELTPTSPLAAPVVRLVGLMWPGYARKALASLEKILTG
jgi:hypothetical protein